MVQRITAFFSRTSRDPAIDPKLPYCKWMIGYHVLQLLRTLGATFSQKVSYGAQGEYKKSRSKWVGQYRWAREAIWLRKRLGYWFSRTWDTGCNHKIIPSRFGVDNDQSGRSNGRELEKGARESRVYFSVKTHVRRKTDARLLFSSLFSSSSKLFHFSGYSQLGSQDNSLRFILSMLFLLMISQFHNSSMVNWSTQAVQNQIWCII